MASESCSVRACLLLHIDRHGIGGFTVGGQYQIHLPAPSQAGVFARWLGLVLETSLGRREQHGRIHPTDRDLDAGGVVAEPASIEGYDHDIRGRPQIDWHWSAVLARVVTLKNCDRTLRAISCTSKRRGRRNALTVRIRR